jgi:hypothetical protein
MLNRREVLRLTVGAATLPLVPLPAFAGLHIVDPIAIHFKRGQFRTWNADELRYDYTGPEVQYRALCLYRSDGLAVAFLSTQSWPLAKAKADALEQMLAFPTPQPDTRCGYNAPWPMSEGQFRAWVVDLKDSVGGY